MRDTPALLLASTILTAASITAIVSAEPNNCRAGGSSYGLSFDRSRADTVSIHAVSIPTESVTVEYWFRSTDLSADYQTVLSYSVRGYPPLREWDLDDDGDGEDAATTVAPDLDDGDEELEVQIDGTALGSGNLAANLRRSVYESSNELHLGITPEFLRVWRGTSSVDLTNKTNPRAATYDDGWRHYALSVDSTNDGEVALYLDGEVLDFGCAAVEIPAGEGEGGNFDGEEGEGEGGFTSVAFEAVDFGSSWTTPDHDDAKNYLGRRQVVPVVVCTAATSAPAEEGGEAEQQQDDTGGGSNCDEKSLSCDVGSVLGDQDQDQEGIEDGADTRWVALIRQSQQATSGCSTYEHARSAAAAGAWAVLLERTEEEEESEEEEEDAGGEGEEDGGGGVVDDVIPKEPPLAVPVLAIEPTVLDDIESASYLAFTRTRQTYRTGTDFINPIVPGGVLHLGQEPDRPFGDFDEMQAANGILDEYRMWKTVRTPQEIRANFRTTIDPTAADASDLYLYWKFDDEPYRAENDPYLLTADSSPGAENPGLIGSLPTIANEMQYITDRPNQPPTVPLRIPTPSSPIVGGGEVVVPVVPGSRVVFELKSYDPDGDDLTTVLRTLPAVGELFAYVAQDSGGETTETDDGGGDINSANDVEVMVIGDALRAGDVVLDEGRTESKRIVYQAPDDFYVQTLNADATFIYVVSDGGDRVVEATVRFVLHRLVRPVSQVITASEDELVHVSLAVPSQLTQGNLRVEITSTPPRGRLYQAQFQPLAYPSYSSLSTRANEHGPMEPIDAEGTVLTNDRGIVMYQPETNEHSDKPGEEYASFTFRLVDAAAGLTSSEARVSVIVTPVNDPPVGVPGSGVVFFGDAATLRLDSTDADADAAESFSDRTFARIVSFPRGGRVFQYDEAATGGRGDYMDSAITEVPQTFSWASRVVRFSSQFSICSSECFAWMHPDCTSNDVLSGGHEDGTCPETGWHASSILGEPDVYPGYQDDKKAFTASSEKYGHEWIELEFPFDIYMSAFELYETFKPGSVWRISTTEEYKDDAAAPCTGTSMQGLPACTQKTDWTMLWTKPQESVTPGPDMAQVFEPPLCPSSTKTRIVRIDFDTRRVLGWNSFDAAKVTGSLLPPPGLLFDPLNRLVYDPLDGVHGTDRLSFTATDCLDEGGATDFTITVTPPEEGSFSTSVFSEQNAVLGASPNAIVDHRLELSDVLKKIKAQSGAEPNVIATVWHTTALGASQGETFMDITLQTRSFIDIKLGTETVVPEKLELWLEDESGLTFRIHVKVAIYVACYNGEVDEARGVCVCGTRKWTGDSCAIQVTEDKNTLSPAVKGVGYAMFFIAIFLCILAVVLVVTKRKVRQVKVMQPFYLYLLLFGCAVSSCTIISLQVEESDAACASIPWLWSMGFSIIVGSLFTKILRVFLVFRSGQRMRRKSLKVKETVGIVAIIVGLNAIVLLCWTVIDPMQWSRNTIEADRDGYVLSSYGRCGSINSTPYLAALCAFNGAFMLLAGILCYKARNIPTEFQEGKYVALSILCCMQVYFIGVPVVVIVGEDPSITIFVTSAIVFLSTVAVLLLIFGPLAWEVFFGEADEMRRSQYAAMIGRSAGLAGRSASLATSQNFGGPSARNFGSKTCSNCGASTEGSVRQSPQVSSNVFQPSSGQTKSSIPDSSRGASRGASVRFSVSSKVDESTSIHNAETDHASNLSKEPSVKISVPSLRQDDTDHVGNPSDDEISLPSLSNEEGTAHQDETDHAANSSNGPPV